MNSIMLFGSESLRLVLKWIATSVEQLRYFIEIYFNYELDQTIAKTLKQNEDFEFFCP